MFTGSKPPRKTLRHQQFPQNLKLQKGGYENFWGSGGGRGPAPSGQGGTVKRGTVESGTVERSKWSSCKGALPPGEPAGLLPVPSLLTTRRGRKEGEWLSPEVQEG